MEWLRRKIIKWLKIGNRYSGYLSTQEEAFTYLREIQSMRHFMLKNNLPWGECIDNSDIFKEYRVNALADVWNCLISLRDERQRTHEASLRADQLPDQTTRPEELP